MVAESRRDQYGTARAEAGVMPGTAAFRRISWGAVFAGVVIIMVLQLVLSLLGIGIGLTTVDPAAGQTPRAGTLGISAAIWWVVINLIAVFAGGWVAARLAGLPRRIDGILHGLVTWGAATLLLFYLLTSTVSSLVSGTLGVVGNAVSAAGQGLTTAAGAVTGLDTQAMERIRQEAQQILSQGGQGGAPTAQQVTNFLQRLASGNVTQADLQNAAAELAERTGMSPQEAQATLQRWQATYQQAVQQARQAAEAAADTAAQASIWSFIALVLGGIAGGVGGMLGAPRDLDVLEVRRTEEVRRT